MPGAISGGDNEWKISIDGGKKAEEDNLGVSTVEGELRQTTRDEYYRN